MRILGLFDKYFLILMIIQGLILIIDSKGFSNWDMKNISRKSKSIGIGIIVIAFVLYLISTYSS